MTGGSDDDDDSDDHHELLAKKSRADADWLIILEIIYLFYNSKMLCSL